MIIDIQKRWEELEKKKYTTIAKEFSMLISTLYKQKKTGTNQIKLINIKNS